VNEWAQWAVVTVTWAFVIWAVYRDQIRWTLPVGMLAGAVLMHWATSVWFVLAYALTAIVAGRMIRAIAPRRVDMGTPMEVTV
jgi:hypothetical protein